MEKGLSPIFNKNDNQVDKMACAFEVVLYISELRMNISRPKWWQRAGVLSASLMTSSAIPTAPNWVTLFSKLVDSTHGITVNMHIFNLLLKNLNK